VSQSPIRVTVWGENKHEHTHEKVRAVYPNGMHNVIAEGIRENLGERVEVQTATLDQPEHGLTDEVLNNTDVLTWWGHMAHKDVSDEIVNKVHQRVLNGMGIIVLHSGHFSKIFKKLCGTSCALRWRESGDKELVWCVKPSHPIAEGLPVCIVVPEQEMYGEPFDIPEPDELVYVSSFVPGGEVFRSGACWTRGAGRLFYFSPGHETYPVYYQPEIRKVISNAVLWAFSPSKQSYNMTVCPNSPIGWYEKKEG